MNQWLLGEEVIANSKLPKILDTTLREGELFQRFRLETKVKVAKLLAEAGLDRIELTVDYPPRTSRRDVEEVVEVLKSYDVEIVIHGRACRRDVEAAAKYDVDGVGVYMAPTRLHREYKFGGIEFREAIDRLRDAIALAKEYGFEYRRATVEDASRFYFEENGFRKLLQIIEELKAEGATIISVPDTSGILTPLQVRKFFGRLKKLCDIPLSAHFHNDYGHASANTIEAALIGVEELQTSILGIGDRNGIADLYEVVAPLIDIHGFKFRLRRNFLHHPFAEKWRNLEEDLGKIVFQFSRWNISLWSFNRHGLMDSCPDSLRLITKRMPKRHLYPSKFAESLIQFSEEIPSKPELESMNVDEGSSNFIEIRYPISIPYSKN